MQRNRKSPPSGGDSGFNPHSSFRPSATLGRAWRVGRIYEFQSSLELSPECNMLCRKTSGCHWVSILTRAFARVQRTHARTRTRTHAVSILTRAFARVQPVDAASSEAQRMFQSSLELSPECNLTQSSPSRPRQRVSILTRAFARVQPLTSKPALRPSLRFQSSLELSPECNDKKRAAGTALE